MKKILLALILSLALFFTLSAEAQGYSYDYYDSSTLQSEEISLFDSTIHIQKDGSLVVTEKITVYAAYQEIKHGIYRDYPTIYPYLKFFKKKYDFEILDIKRDGVYEPYHTEQLSNGIRIYIGDENKYVSIGNHTYEISYRVYNQVGFFDRYDELYYNITGNGWAFPINNAQAHVYLPPGVPSTTVHIEGYTGRTGFKGQEYYTNISDFPEAGSSIAYINSTAELQSKEGLTVVVTWPKGFVSEPTLLQEVQTFIKSNSLLIINSVITFILLLYYLIVWIWIGRDPKGRTIIPLFSPPHGISPAEMRYIDKMGFDNKAITAALTSAASKGYIKITESGKKFTIEKLKEDYEDLSPEEASLLDDLFKWTTGSFTFKQKSHNKIRKSIQEVKKFLEMQFDKNYVKKNSKYMLPAILLNLLPIIYLLFSYAKTGIESRFLLFWIALWSIGTISIIFKVTIPSWNNYFSNWKDIGLAIKGCFNTIFTLPFIVAGLFVSSYAMGKIDLSIIFFLFLQIVLHVVFHYSIKARTGKGREVQDKIEGFKMFLKATEEERIKILHRDVPKSIEEYEKYLPYAIALNIETNWMKQFKKEIDKIEKNTGEKYSPYWYTGTHYMGSSFGSSISSSLSSSISSSSAAPGSSSGAGGGGGSGGGGGGGGGGGW